MTKQAKGQHQLLLLLHPYRFSASICTPTRV